MDFLEIDIDSIDMIRKSFLAGDNMACELCAGNIFVWNENKNSYLKVEDEILIRRKMGDKDFFYYSRLSEEMFNILEQIITEYKQINKHFIIMAYSKENADRLQAINEELIVSVDRANQDYVYDVKELANLTGKKYHGKKNHINFFLKNYEYGYEKITSENALECLKVAQKWYEKNKDNEDKEEYISMKTELNVITVALENFESLNFVGGLIRVDGKIRAFTLGEKLNEFTFVTHFEKAEASIRGLYPMINREFTRNELGAYDYVNREEDMGVEGLRSAKLSYHPAFLVEKFSVEG